MSTGWRWHWTRVNVGFSGHASRGERRVWSPGQRSTVKAQERYSMHIHVFVCAGSNDLVRTIVHIYINLLSQSRTSLTGSCKLSTCTCLSLHPADVCPTRGQETTPPCVMWVRGMWHSWWGSYTLPRITGRSSRKQSELVQPICMAFQHTIVLQNCIISIIPYSG